MADINSEMRESEFGTPPVQSVTKTTYINKKMFYVFENEEVEFLIYVWSIGKVAYNNRTV
jgi:hypothetical protein